jgi:hypothetical protein
MKLESRVERLEKRSAFGGRCVVAFANDDETDEQAEARAADENDIGPNDHLIVVTWVAANL